MSGRNRIARLDVNSARRALRQMGKSLGGNLIRRAARAALIPVREAQRSAWMGESFREGPSGVRRRRRRKGSASGRQRRRGSRRPIVVRRAIARAITLKVDRTVRGKLVAAVGINYARRGLQRQHRIAHIVEGGRKGGRGVRGRFVSQRVNLRMRPQVERAFIAAVEKGLRAGR